MTTPPALHSALRLMRRSPLRSAIVITAIALPTALATACNIADWADATPLTWGALAVALTVLLATQASPEPNRLATTAAWHTAGASRSTSERPHRFAGLLLAWTGAAVGIGIGSVVGVAAARNHETWRPVLVLTLALALTGAVALFPSPHHSRSRRRLALTEWLKVIGGFVLAAAIVVTIRAVGSVRTDRDASLVVPFAATVTILVISLALGPLLHAALTAARQMPALRPLLPAASRHRTPLVVRGSVVAAMVVAFTATVFGASVGARAVRYQHALAQLRQAPVVPPTVMAVTMPIADDRGNNFVTGALPGGTVDAIRHQYPDAAVIPVMWVTDPAAYVTQQLGQLTADGSSVNCFPNLACAAPVIVADSQLAAVYGQPGRPSNLTLSLGAGNTSQTVHASVSAPPADTLINRRAHGAPMPAATFQDLAALEINPDLAAALRAPTAIRTIFVTRPRSFTATERAALQVLVSTHRPNGAPAKAITSDDRSNHLHSPVGQVPWAPTARSTQWSIASIAALFALLVVLSSTAVDALDRRRDNARLELLGATPSQIRGAAALYTGLVLGISAVLTAAAVTALVAYGVERFSASRPAIAVPFVLPVTQFAVLVVGIPLIGAVIAAASARGTPPRSSSEPRSTDE